MEAINLLLEGLIKQILPNLINALVYVVIALVTLVGVIKCHIPVLKRANDLRRAIRRLEKSNPSGPAIWQEQDFLGKKLRSSWQRFLLNAEQLDARSLPCDVEDYINDDSVVHGPGHSQLAEVIPSILMSLGILGTFMRLVQGLSGLDMSGAEKTMAAIPVMINGMHFAFQASVAGIACSLFFNIVFRIIMGRAYKALDEFSETFALLVMQRPLDSQVQLICQGQDRNVLLGRLAEDMGGKLAGSMETAIGRAMHPVTLAMDHFIVGATQEQITGVRQIVGDFIEGMNESLSGQFLKLGETMTAINQSQTVSQEHLTKSMSAAQDIVQEVTRLGSVTQTVMERFGSYVDTMQSAKQSDAEFMKRAEGLLGNMHKASEQQAAYLGKLQEYQAALQGSLQQYTTWSDQMLEGVGGQAKQLTEGMGKATEQMQEGSRLLAGSYSSFVENISEGLARALAMFDENMHDLIQTMNAALEDINAAVTKVPDQIRKSSDRYGQQVDLYVGTISQLQQAVSDIARAVEQETPEKGHAKASTAVAEGASA